MRLYTAACKARRLFVGRFAARECSSSSCPSEAQKRTFPSSDSSTVQWAYRSRAAFKTAPPNRSQKGDTSVPPPAKPKRNGARQRINKVYVSLGLFVGMFIRQ